MRSMGSARKNNNDEDLGIDREVADGYKRVREYRDKLKEKISTLTKEIRKLRENQDAAEKIMAQLFDLHLDPSRKRNNSIAKSTIDFINTWLTDMINGTQTTTTRKKITLGEMLLTPISNDNSREIIRCTPPPPSSTVYDDAASGFLTIDVEKGDGKCKEPTKIDQGWKPIEDQLSIVKCRNGELKDLDEEALKRSFMDNFDVKKLHILYLGTLLSSTMVDFIFFLSDNEADKIERIQTFNAYFSRPGFGDTSKFKGMMFNLLGEAIEVVKKLKESKLESVKGKQLMTTTTTTTTTTDPSSSSMGEGARTNLDHEDVDDITVKLFEVILRLDHILKHQEQPELNALWEDAFLSVEDGLKIGQATIERVRERIKTIKRQIAASAREVDRVVEILQRRSTMQLKIKEIWDAVDGMMGKEAKEPIKIKVMGFKGTK